MQELPGLIMRSDKLYQLNTRYLRKLFGGTVLAVLGGIFSYKMDLPLRMRTCIKLGDIFSPL